MVLSIIFWQLSIPAWFGCRATGTGAGDSVLRPGCASVLSGVVAGVVAVVVAGDLVGATDLGGLFSLGSLGLLLDRSVELGGEIL